MSYTIHNTITPEGKTAPSPKEVEPTDICLLLEGTYPFVSGGVSSWVHSLIRGLPDFTFTLLVILPDHKKKEYRYQIPDNVKSIFIHPLYYDEFLKKPLIHLPENSSYLKGLYTFHQKLQTFSKKSSQALDETNKEAGGEDTLLPFHQQFQQEFVFLIENLKWITQKFEQQNWSIPKRMTSRKTWDLINQFYRESNLNCSFVDYYWTWRYLHFGLFSILNATIPKASIYHAVSTGYAGLFGARASIKYNAPLLLTEHGIYNKERKIDISRSPWIYEENKHLFRAQDNTEIFKELWIKAFTVMSKLCYSCSNTIITLYTGNQKYQLQDGADPERMQIIPNGIDFQKLSNLERSPQEKKIIGFVGRIVPIKDVKTFIRAISLVLRSYPDAEAWMMGPTDENEEYFEECRQLVEFLDLEGKVKFTGMVDLQHYYPKLDILVLTSISEAQPLVILEAYCQKIPIVATDVGACRELAEGAPGEDAELGKSGIITGLTNPAETALSILHLLRHSEEAKAMGEAGYQRVQKFYDLPILFERYRELYKSHQGNIET